MPPNKTGINDIMERKNSIPATCNTQPAKKPLEKYISCALICKEL